MEALPPKLVAALGRMGLLPNGTCATGERLGGGVSSDIWRVQLPGREICIKRALPRLRVAAEWHAPVERNVFEARWMREAGSAVPGAAPELLGQDEATGALAMAYLDPPTHPVWKQELRDGRADEGFAAKVGERLGRIHATTAAKPELAGLFPTDQIFHAIRLEPYLLATARAHPGLAPALQDLVSVTAREKRALVHGDISPKNILVGPAGPVFLDAECAWWGDPAFDLAFCLNHLLLKCLWTPAAAKGFLRCFTALAGGYFEQVNWEPAEGLEARAARLLPGLFLARVDGKSPVEYIQEDSQRNHVRRTASHLLRAPPSRLRAIRDAWGEELGL